MSRSSLRSIDRQVTLGLAVALTILLAVMAYARSRGAALDEATAWVDHTHHGLAGGRAREGTAAHAAASVDAARMASYRELSARVAGHEQMLLTRRAERRVRARRDLDRAVVLGALAAILLALAAAARLRGALAVRERIEQERDAHARALELQSLEVEAQHQELMAQGESLQLAMDQAESANHTRSMFLAR